MLTYLGIVDHARLASIEFMEKNVSVWVRKHERSGEVVPCDEPVTLILVILPLEKLEGLLDVKVRILEEQLTLLLNKHL